MLTQAGTEDGRQVFTETSPLIERAVLAAIVDGVIVNDVAGDVVLLNQAAARLLHVSAEEARERPVRALFANFSTRGRLPWPAPSRST